MSLPPWVVFNAANKASAMMDAGSKALIPKPVQILQIIEGQSKSRVMETLALLGIPDLLAAGPKTAPELAREGGFDPAYLFRLLRSAVAAGLLDAKRQGGADGELAFSNNGISELLMANHPASMKGLVQHFGIECWDAWGKLPESIRDGKPNFEKAFNGQNIWDWLQADPAWQDNFNKAMQSVDALSRPALLADYDWSRYSRLLDIGGAHGSVLNALLLKHPNAQGVLFDQPHVVQSAKEGWQQHHEVHSDGVAPVERVEFVGGSFFDADTLPKGKQGDAYFLRNILHDWKDADSTAILKALRAAMGDCGATLVLLEMSPEEDVGDSMGFSRYHMDCHMMAMCDGKERTKREWAVLLAGAGFELVAMRPTRSIFCTIKAKPVPAAAAT